MDIDKKRNIEKEIAEIPDVSTYDASEGQNPTIHYNANSKKGFPRDVNIQSNDNVGFSYEDETLDIKSSTQE